MKVRAINDFDCPTHLVRAGSIADLPKAVALPGVRAGLLVAVDAEQADATGGEVREKKVPTKRKTAKRKRP